MKQKFQLKNLLKKKPARLTIAEMMIDPAFTVLTDEQKAAKKAGFTDDVLVNNNLEKSIGLMNIDGLESKLTRTKRSNYGRQLPEVVITASPINHNNDHYSQATNNPFNTPDPHQARDQQRRISARYKFFLAQYDREIINANKGKNKPFFQGINPIYSRTELRTIPNPNYNAITPVKNPPFKFNGSTKLYDAMVNMISSIDLTLSGTQAAAKTLSVQLPKYMSIAGKFTAWTGPLDNALQMGIEGFNWNDASQLATGAALIGVAAIGGTAAAPVVFIGGLGLFVWELGETYINQQKN
jgi:hypothetical protein